LGSAMMTASLKQAGHEVKVYDYAYLRGDERSWPALRTELEAFRPQLVGVSVYTSSVSAALNIARQARELLHVPVVAGGPHTTLNPDRMIAQDCIDTVVVGDGEIVLPQIAADPAKYAKQIVVGGQVDVKALPMADFSSFYRHDRIRSYPLMTSRGCPFHCSFCTVHTVTSRKWRPREMDSVFAELDAAVAQFPKLLTIEVHDDCPTTDVKRFKQFLRGIIDRRLNAALSVANIRADTVDEELVDLLIQAGSRSICIAAEHGNPQVFEFIGKSEKLEDIERAARIIKRKGAKLRLCFVIGLPKDNLTLIRDSIRLARRLKPSLIYWNMAHPFRHTRIREWYEANGGTIRNDDDHSSYVEPSLTCDEPIVSTPDFTAEQRKRAKFLCVVETDQYRLRDDGLRKLFSIAWNYGYTWAAVRSVARKVLGLSYH
ncbi:MAG TPA: radical SAM protein, partial [Planctomycetota bacterium]|nr:radical SAM protein [Planctomycetota bacterium]